MSQFLDGLHFTQMADGRGYRVDAPFRYQSDLLLSGRAANIIEVPRLRITDLASTPRILWSKYPPWERYSAAAVIHDELYWTHDVERDIADKILREAMIVLAVDSETVEAVYSAVHVFGEYAWNHNAKLKAAGYEKIASDKDLPPYASPV